MSLKSLSDLDWKALQSQSFHPSPLAWEAGSLFFIAGSILGWQRTRLSRGRRKPSHNRSKAEI